MRIRLNNVTNQNGRIYLKDYETASNLDLGIPSPLAAIPHAPLALPPTPPLPLPAPTTPTPAEGESSGEDPNPSASVAPRRPALPAPTPCDSDCGTLPNNAARAAL